MIAAIFIVIVVAAVIAMVLCAAGLGPPLIAVSAFASRWLARALLLGFGIIVVQMLIEARH